MPLVGLDEIEVFPHYTVGDKDNGRFQVNLTAAEMKLISTYEKLDDAVQTLLRRKYEEQEEKLQKRVDAQNRTDR